MGDLNCTRCGKLPIALVKNSTLCPNCHKLAKDEWATPPDLWQAMKTRWNFKMDVCASTGNTKCNLYLTKSDDSFSVGHSSWIVYGDAWCNPGFSKPLPWLEEAYVQVTGGSKSRVVVCGIADCSTQTFAFAHEHCSRIILLTPRVDYIPAPGITASTSPRPSLLYEFTGKWGRATDKCEIVLWDWKAELDKMDETG